jgi:hypothetical protein
MSKIFLQKQLYLRNQSIENNKKQKYHSSRLTKYFINKLRIFLC